MAYEENMLYEIDYVEPEPEPEEVDPQTYKRDFTVARQVISDAVTMSPDKKVDIQTLVRVVTGWRADNNEVVVLIDLKKQINALTDQIEDETEQSIIDQLTSQRNNLQVRFDSHALPNFISNPLETAKRLKRGRSIAGVPACKGISATEVESLIKQMKEERRASWTFNEVEDPILT
jgi:hypothetical protein